MAATAGNVIRVKTASQDPRSKCVDRSNLYLATAIVNVGVFSMGSLYSWTSPSIPKLRASNSWLPLDTDQASWVGSLIAFGSIFGPFLGGWLVDSIGRKPTIVLAVATGMMSWAVLFQAGEVWEVYVSRIVGGVGGGIIFTAVPLYIGEIAEDNIRSALSSLFNLFITLGMLLEYLVGPYVSYRSLILVSGVALVIFFLTSPVVPESPYFHLQQDRQLAAHKSLVWLRKGAPEEQVIEEMSTLKQSIDDTAKAKGSFLDLFRSASNRKALLLSCGCVIFQQLSGINVVLFYSQTIFEMAGQSILGPSESTIVVGVILTVAAAVAVPLTHHFGIKIMLLISALGMALFLGMLGLYFYLLASGNDTSGYSWLPILSLIGFVIIYSFGFGPLPWAVMAEVFPPNVKATASALTSSACWAVSFILTKLFPILAEQIGNDFVFWGFALSCIAAFFFVLFLLPDTKGMSLQEIQDSLHASLDVSRVVTPSPKPSESRRSTVVTPSLATIN